MSGAANALAWIGPVAFAAAWLVVRLRGVSIWVAMGLAAGPLGLFALVVGEVRATAGDGLGAPAAAGLGLAAGLALYAATAAFMYLFRAWPLLGRQAGAIYAMRGDLPLWAALAIAALVVAPGEELLWRGVVADALAGQLGAGGAAAVAYAIYVAAGLPSGSLPIVLGTVVGGAAWAALAWGTGGVLASALAHVTWTALMILSPPVFGAPGGPGAQERAGRAP